MRLCHNALQVEHTCETCGARFTTPAGNVRWCPGCRRASYRAEQKRIAKRNERRRKLTVGASA